MEYFSDKEQGHKARNERQISPEVWAGIVAHIHSLIDSGAFGLAFPKTCPDDAEVIGTDEAAFYQVLKAEIPDVELPIQKNRNLDNSSTAEPYAPYIILDLIQFCYRYVAKPNQRGYHDFFKHHHLSFDVEEGRQEFRGKINRIFARNGISYELEESGDIKRLASPILGERFATFRFNVQRRDTLRINRRIPLRIAEGRFSNQKDWRTACTTRLNAPAIGSLSCA